MLSLSFRLRNYLVRWGQPLDLGLYRKSSSSGSTTHCPMVTAMKYVHAFNVVDHSYCPPAPNGGCLSPVLRPRSTPPNVRPSLTSHIHRQQLDDFAAPPHTEVWIRFVRPGLVALMSVSTHVRKTCECVCTSPPTRRRLSSGSAPPLRYG